ncbi:MAG TPA: ABC transporter C-terminal domain-containing protein, partial [Roseiflexaceae bacterium]|nr:ABC transporter C-terminal domain-containing protein [Roseiflexaceae bacterium]
QTSRQADKDARSNGHSSSPASGSKPQVSSNGTGQASSPKPQGASKDDRRRQRRLAALEEEIAMLEAEMKQLAEEMTAASVQADGKRVKSLELQYSDVQEMLNTRYDEWSAAAG